MADKRIPVILLTGFLGSGKTTLLDALLRDPAMAGAAVLINEVGEAGLDHLLVAHLSEEVILLASGCLCCRMRGDLSRSLRDLFMRRLRREIGALDRVIIETSGLADPAPVIRTLLRDFFLAERFRLEGVITTLDLTQAHWQLDQHAEAQRQVAMADRVVLTKSDLATPEQISSVSERAHALNPAASLWRAGNQEVPTGLLLGLYDPASKAAAVLDWLGESAVRARQQPSGGVFAALKKVAGPSQDFLGPHGGLLAPEGRSRGLVNPSLPVHSAGIHSARIGTHVIRFAQPLAWGVFSAALDAFQALAGERILRIKGLLAVQGEEGPRVIHAVQHVRYPDTRLAAWPDADHASRLVFVLRDMPEQCLRQAFAECGAA